MALFRWQCLRCKKKFQLLLADRPEVEPICCGESMEPMAGTGSVSVMEVRDNGIMARRLERYSEAEELRKSHGEILKPKDDGIV